MTRLVVGCGFLGLPLAKQWAGDSISNTANTSPSATAAIPPTGAGTRTWGTTRSTQRANAFERDGITPLVCDVTDLPSMKAALSGLPHLDTIVFAVGMDRSRYDDIRDVYVKGLERFFDSYPHPIKHFIYISSTGVFGSFDGQWIDETAPANPARPGGQACLEAEQLIAERTDRWTVLRMAGLYGGQRVPTRQIIKDKTWDKLSPHGYLNLIHQTDAVHAIIAAADRKPMAEIIHCSDGHPPTRQAYYQYIADQFELGEIPWPQDTVVDANSRSANSKRIGNRKMRELLKFDLMHPDFRSGLAEAFLA